MNHVDPTPEHRKVMEDVTTERHHQIEKGWTPQHDDKHHPVQMIRLAGERLSARDAGRRLFIQAIAILVAAVEAMDRKAGR